MAGTKTDSTGVTFPDATSQTTARTTSNTVTSASAGNGIAVSAGTGAVTFSVAAPGFNTVGSYASLLIASSFGAIVSPGATASGSVLRYANWSYDACSNIYSVYGTPIALSGTWRFMGNFNNGTTFALFVRVA